ncbi:putative amino-acid N-acetyltransferase [Helianthus annuus]|nr:putative amino-acid N-acetyltransferase [Helianthus annuus]
MQHVGSCYCLCIGAWSRVTYLHYRWPILDEWGRLIRFLTLEDADMLIRRRAKQSEIAGPLFSSAPTP